MSVTSTLAKGTNVNSAFAFLVQDASDHEIVNKLIGSTRCIDKSQIKHILAIANPTLESNWAEYVGNLHPLNVQYMLHIQ